ncbi:MAG: hypothetical protein K0U66_09675 [Gammaproteobacteria bacterium]|nr:hypothetical protein [Pseudomonadota bacterium]MCH9663903.1 hypothetical protein [Gammaproteobacteria bacterium]
MNYIIIAVGAVFALLWLRRKLRLSLATSILVVLAVAAVVYLTLTGRMNWLFTLVATVALVLFRLLRSPFAFAIIGWMRRLFSRYPSGPGVFRSQYVLIRIDPFSGNIDGEVLHGQFTGMRLSQMSEEQIGQLVEECTGVDAGAVRVLNIYLNYLRRFGFARTGGADADHDSGEGGIAQAPSLAQACEILGVSNADNWRTVTEARQRLLSRLHPDKGGSVWIAQRINAAWEVLRHTHPHSPDKDKSIGRH